MRLSSASKLFVALIVAPGGFAWANGGGGMPSQPLSGSGSSLQSSAEAVAISAYNAGVRTIKDAKEYEQDAAKAEKDDKKTKYIAKAEKAYEKAAAQFAAAIEQHRNGFWVDRI